jgi:hypothetical protein
MQDSEGPMSHPVLPVRDARKRRGRPTTYSDFYSQARRPVPGCPDRYTCGLCPPPPRGGQRKSWANTQFLEHVRNVHALPQLALEAELADQLGNGEGLDDSPRSSRDTADPSDDAVSHGIPVPTDDLPLPTDDQGNASVQFSRVNHCIPQSATQ